MKHLNVKWVPETFAIVSLTIGAGTGVECGAGEVKNLGASPRNETPTKRIIISQGTELRACVVTTR